MYPHHILLVSRFFFFNYTATTEIYTLSLHDALPISYFADESRASLVVTARSVLERVEPALAGVKLALVAGHHQRSGEHTSELQSPDHLVCRLLLVKKKEQSLLVAVCGWRSRTRDPE